MNVIIAGAGDMGFHIAELLTNLMHAITIIDLDQDALDNASDNLDLNVLNGDSSSLAVLENADAADTDLLLAVTTSEKNNLITAILGKKMGVKWTIARVDNPEYLTERQKKGFADLGVDHLISPTHLAAKEILRLIKHEALIDIFDLPEDKLSIIGVALDSSTHIINKTVLDVGTADENLSFRPIVILRGKTTIIPRAHTYMMRNDHLYLITRTSKIPELLKFIGKENKAIKNVMILGGNDICKEAASLIQKRYNLKVILEDRGHIDEIMPDLRDALVIQGDPTDLDLLISEEISRMDVVISMTENNEANILTSLLARENGVFKTVACVDNIDYTTLSQSIGVDTLINKKLIAANEISRYVRQGKIEAITSFHGVDGELIEYVLHHNNKLIKKPIKELDIPDQTMIAAVVRDGSSYIPHGDFQLQANDKVIIFAMTEVLDTVETLFR